MAPSNDRGVRVHRLPMRNGLSLKQKGLVRGRPFAATGSITPGEAGTIAAVVDTFVRAIETSDFDRRLKIMEGELLDRHGDGPEMFGAGNPGNSTFWRAFAADPR
jgi:hypothetical protein